jgi:hypothetical protein
MAKLLFAVMNIANSLHMCTIPKLWQHRMTVWTQHTVSILSLLMLLLPTSSSSYLQFLQSTVTCLTTGVAFLFTGLLLVFGLLGRAKNATPLSKLPLTTSRVLRNLWSHYGIAFAMWHFVLTDLRLWPTLQHQVAANVGYLLWAAWYGARAKEIYDVPESVNLVQSGALPVMVTFWLLFNVVLYWIIAR